MDHLGVVAEGAAEAEDRVETVVSVHGMALAVAMEEVVAVGAASAEEDVAAGGEVALVEAEEEEAVAVADLEVEVLVQPRE